MIFCIAFGLGIIPGFISGVWRRINYPTPIHLERNCEIAILYLFWWVPVMATFDPLFYHISFHLTCKMLSVPKEGRKLFPSYDFIDED